MDENTTLISNNVSSGYFGIFLFSSNMTMVNNSIINTTYGLSIAGTTDENFNHSIDFSNRINGKPIYYIKKQFLLCL
jgi:parallel beta-helix repeat protein